MPIIGIDIGGTNIRVGEIDNSIIKEVHKAKIQHHGDEESVLEQIFEMTDRVFNKSIEGIGIGVPSVVDVEKGVVYNVQNISSWKEVPLKKLFEERYKVPIKINNDANCYTLGEFYFGKAKGYKNIVGLITGTGVGAGLIIDGKLYLGKNNDAGEFGMLPYIDHNYEYYCGGQFFKNRYNISGEELSIKAASGDTEALKIFGEYGAHLGNAIKVILYTVDPEIIIIGGSVSKSYNFYQEEMFNSLKDFIYQHTLENLVIEVSDLEFISILGPASLFIDDKENIAAA
jgi:glucokinase